MVDIEKIKELTFQKRMVEAFKVIRKEGIGARLGPAWDAQRQLRRTNQWTYMPQYYYTGMNGWGQDAGHLNCSSHPVALAVSATLNNHGIASRVPPQTIQVNYSGIDNSLIGKKELKLALKDLTIESLIETYSLD